jgi:hypothetical protein
MELRIKPKISIEKVIKISEFWYDPKEDSIFFEMPYPFPVQLKIIALKTIEVTPGFLRLPTILRGHINHDYLGKYLDSIQLVQEGKFLVHGSCVDNCLIVGFPESGKTYNTYKSVSEGATLISEEYTVIDGNTASAYRGECKSSLSLNTIKECGIELTAREKSILYYNFIRSKLFPYLYGPTVSKTFVPKKESSEIKYIVYGSTEDLITDYKKLIMLTDNEFPFVSEGILQAYAYITGFDLLDVQEKQRQLIKEFVCSL